MKDVISVDSEITEYATTLLEARRTNDHMLEVRNRAELKRRLHSLLISKLPTKKYVDMTPSLKTGSQTVTIPTYNEAIDDMHQVIDELFGVK